MVSIALSTIVASKNNKIPIFSVNKDKNNRDRILTLCHEIECQVDYAFVNDDYSACIEILSTIIPPKNPHNEELIIRATNDNTNKTDDKPKNILVKESSNK